MQPDSKLLAMFGVAAALDVALAVVVALVVRKKTQARWAVLAVGAFAFVGAQLVRIALMLAFKAAFPDAVKQLSASLVAGALVGSITAALFEETARYVAYSRVLKNERDWNHGLMLGAGHGGIEAVFVGLMVLAQLANAVVLFKLGPDALAKLTPDQLSQVEAAKTTFLGLRWWEPLLGAWERVCALGLQLAMSLLVLQVFVRKNLAWLFGSMGVHAVVNFAAVMVMKRYGGVAAEAMLTFVLAGALVWIVRARRVQPA